MYVCVCVHAHMCVYVCVCQVSHPAAQGWLSAGNVRCVRVSM